MSSDSEYNHLNVSFDKTAAPLLMFVQTPNIAVGGVIV